MKEHDYGGAFDIDPKEYYSKDDLMELKAAIEEKLNGRMQGTYEIAEIYLGENETLDITYTDSNKDEWHLCEEIQLDPKLAGTAKELCEVYANKVARTIINEHRAFVKELDDERDREWGEYE